MKYRAPIAAFLTACSAQLTAANAQTATPPPDRGNSMPAAAAPSAEQLARLKAVLAPYNPAALKADDAKAIKRALRDAGLRPGPALDKALADAGFSAQRLEALDPRPPGPPGPPRP